MYEIVYLNSTDQWLMGGVAEDLLSSHLTQLLAKHNVVKDAWSESHAIQLLADIGVGVELVGDDGFPVEY